MYIIRDLVNSLSIYIFIIFSFQVEMTKRNETYYKYLHSTLVIAVGGGRGEGGRVKRKEIALPQASSVFGISMNTIHDKVHRKSPMDPVPRTTLIPEDEPKSKLAPWLMTC